MTVPRLGVVVGVSISESPDLIRHGLAEIHVRHAWVEVTRHVLAAGGSVAYGGDLRPGGYTEALFDMLRAYERHDRPGPERVLNYLAWPLWGDLDAATRAALRPVATLVEVQAPKGAPAVLPDPAERSAEERLWYSLSLSAMREGMTRRIGARLVLGGRVAGHHGLYPGVIEEAALAVRAGLPLFTVGGFGGAGHVIARALDGDQPEELTLAYQRVHTAGYEALLSAAAERHIEPDPALLAGALADAGWEGVNNGLTGEENRRLAATDDVDEIVALLLTGLRRAL